MLTTTSTQREHGGLRENVVFEFLTEKFQIHRCTTEDPKFPKHLNLMNISVYFSTYSLELRPQPETGAEPPVRTPNNATEKVPEPNSPASSSVVNGGAELLPSTGGSSPLQLLSLHVMSVISSVVYLTAVKCMFYTGNPHKSISWIGS